MVVSKQKDTYKPLTISLPDISKIKVRNGLYLLPLVVSQ